MGCRSNLVLIPGQSLGEVVAIVGACSSSAPEATPPQFTPYICWESKWALSALRWGSTARQRWRRLRAVISREGQRRLAPEAASEQSKGNNCRRLHRQCIGDSLDLCLQVTQAKSPYGPPSPLGQDSLCWERRKLTLRGKGASLGPTLRASAPVTWDQIPPPIGQWGPLSRGEVPPHTQLQL